MATNELVGDDAWKGSLKKRSKLRTEVMGKKTWTKCDDSSDEFISTERRKPPRRCGTSRWIRLHKPSGWKIELKPVQFVRYAHL